MPTSFRWKAGLIILIAILVRFAFVIAVDKGKVPFEHNPDAEDYLSFAHNLATGVGFAHAINEDQPFSQPVEFSAWRTPLYPMFLAIAFQVSRGTLFLQSLQIALSAFSLYFLLRLSSILFGETAALITGLAFAFYLPLIIYSADLGTESLFLFLLTAVLFLFYQAGKEHSPGRVFSLGVLVGLAALCRPNRLNASPSSDSRPLADNSRSKTGASPDNRARPGSRDDYPSVDLSQLPPVSQVCANQYQRRSKSLVRRALSSGRRCLHGRDRIFPAQRSQRRVRT